MPFKRTHVHTQTYLQHHSHETVVYDDSNWSFVLAAFETVDRKFGYGIDSLHHHITDGHVAHHLFFTQIPHYNLMIATEVRPTTPTTHTCLHTHTHARVLCTTCPPLLFSC